ncbi:MAG: HAMP domain-containing histidine kinase [Ignavibacteriales bacterium]|nr:HAMP domain-containing histidine kinase [Ignavibacteriales bacterium]
MQYTPDIIPLREFTIDVISLLKDQANAKEIDLKLVIGDDLHFTADANMLRSALQNLISNAIKFTARGGKIEVCALFNETTILFSVEDSGVGIPQKVMDQLFDINHKYQMSGTDKEPGTGLGLIFCKELIEKQGGSLTVESEVKKGSKFTILLPKRV